MKTWWVERPDGRQEQVNADYMEITDYGVACFETNGKLVIAYNQHTWYTIVEGES